MKALQSSRLLRSVCLAGIFAPLAFLVTAGCAGSSDAVAVAAPTVAPPARPEGDPAGSTDASENVEAEASGPHFARGMVSITFDDGWVGQATLGLPRLAKRGWKGTFYLVPNWFGGSLDGESFMSVDQARAIAQAGHEIGNHTVDHPNLRRMREPAIFHELNDCSQTLSQELGIPLTSITSFATPHGASNRNVINDAHKLFTSHRTGKARINTPLSDPYMLGAVLLESDNTNTPGRTQADVLALLHQTAADKQWLVLVFHGLVQGKVFRGTDEPIELFDQVLDEIAESGLDVVTVQQGVEQMHASAGRISAPPVSATSPLSTMPEWSGFLPD